MTSNLIINKDSLKKYLLLALVCINFTPSFATQPISLKISHEQQINNSNYIKMLPDTIIDSDLTLVGDGFSALLTKPSAQILKVPQGTRLIGTITQIVKARHLQQSSRFKAHISHLLLPDGKLVKASMDISSSAAIQKLPEISNFRKTTKSILKNSAQTSTAALVGAVDSIQYAGLGTAIATSGISVAAGAAAGLGLGLSNIFIAKGAKLSHNSFTAYNYKIESELEILGSMPILGQDLNTPETSVIGLDSQILNIQEKFSKDFGKFLQVELQLSNNSTENFYIGDFALSSSLLTKYLFNNPLLSRIDYQSLKPGQKKTYTLAFNYNNDYEIKNELEILIIDPINQEAKSRINLQASK
ncbi:MAG: hypothetical protein LW817_05420 [Candidatus Caenarcaniphilales bacterium]|jgi:hypothetical protein|nr:hypothetical protein [Candidatus Caenarcaniphilales bacterium]